MKENRCSLRVNYRANINITFASGETIKASTRDISDGGLLIDCPAHPPVKEGDLAEVVVLGIQDAIPRPVEIVRIDYKGNIAIQFITS
jgi:c-di-GMP-binding flagellar brake protein YcgR